MAKTPLSAQDTVELQRRKLKLLQVQEKLENELPHTYGWPWYPWAKKFFDSTNSVNLLCAANQISKSSTQIRKCIDWATNVNKWPSLWQRKPNQFWYLYPSKDVATAEFNKKWVPEFLPRGSMKDDAVYGWRAEMDKKHIKAIHFYSGVTIYFKTYAQGATTLQSGSVYAMFCDEELPVALYDELQFRLSATGGYFHMVFTATLGQEFWWRCMECVGGDMEELVDAFKIQISMYDCLTYEDESPSPWTVEKIKSIEKKCKSKAEVLRRVYGKFIKEEGRKYHAFDPTRHYVAPYKIPETWSVYSGVDIGSGGPKGHPSAMAFIAVDPSGKKGVVFKGWRGDGIYTTAGQVLSKYCELRGSRRPVLERYDFASADFGQIANSLGEGFTHAEKSHAKGEEVINTLFHNDMLHIFDDPELRKLGVELLNLQKSTPKTKAKDDFADAMRYGVVSIPWDFEGIEGRDLLVEIEKPAPGPLTEKQLIAQQIDQRRGIYGNSKEEEGDDWQTQHNAEIAEWNSQYGN